MSYTVALPMIKAGQNPRKRAGEGLRQELRSWMVGKAVGQEVRAVWRVVARPRSQSPTCLALRSLEP